MELNELQSGDLQITFYDEDLALVVPTTIKYRIDDWESETEILDWTNVAPASTITIDLIKSRQTIINLSLNEEKHIVTIIATTDADHQLTGEFDIWTKNLKFLP